LDSLQEVRTTLKGVGLKVITNTVDTPAMQQLKCNAMKNVRAGRFEILLAILKICCKQLHIHKQGEAVLRSSFNKPKFRQELRDIQSARQICSFVRYDVPVKSG